MRYTLILTLVLATPACKEDLVLPPAGAFAHSVGGPALDAGVTDLDGMLSDADVEGGGEIDAMPDDAADGVVDVDAGMADAPDAATATDAGTDALADSEADVDEVALPPRVHARRLR